MLIVETNYCVWQQMINSNSLTISRRNYTRRNTLLIERNEETKHKEPTKELTQACVKLNKKRKIHSC